MIRFLHGDCRVLLRTLAAESAQCCVTSPPYWGLRDYGTGTWDGGEAGCDHRDDSRHQIQGATSARAGRSNTEAQRNETFRDICGKCGALRIDAQLGLERTPEGYVANMVDVFREVRRVLRDDGTLWLNLGDSYSNAGTRQGNRGDSLGAERQDDCRRFYAPTVPGLKNKDLVGIPWHVAFALQADGWYLRSDIIWHKPNPMPESVRDRTTKSHEYVFLLTKNERYYYDADAIAEPAAFPNGMNGNSPVKSPYGQGFAAGRSDGSTDGTRNARSVWTITTKPYSGAHFAVMPPELAERCIKAGSKPGDTILDPFAGAGTTGLVADRLGRGAVLIDLKADYIEMGRHRIKSDAPLFTQVTA